MQYNLIIPSAGSSTRFPNMRPKWTLTHPNGNLMLIEAIKGLNLNIFDNIIVTVLKDHINLLGGTTGIFKAFEEKNLIEKFNLVILDIPTQSQPETVVKSIEKMCITGPIFIKDVDNYFEFTDNLIPENGVCIYDLQQMTAVNPSNKSYIMLDDKNFIENIVEKTVISSKFCCGGYSFLDACSFVETFKEIQSPNLYISHIIFKMILNGIQFKPIKVKNYIDWGTIEDWNKYKSEYYTLFVDIDGVIVKNSGKYFTPTWGETEGLLKNIKRLNELYDSGKVQIILTTSRQKAYEKQTIEQLEKYKVKYDSIVFDLLHGKRIVINDFGKTNPYESCKAINIQRNQEILEELI